MIGQEVETNLNLYRRTFDRRRLALPLAFPTLCGIFWLGFNGATAQIVLINMAAFALALIWIGVGRLPVMPTPRRLIATLLVVLLFVPLVTGPQLSGISRWMPLGPVSLHSGMLVMPLLVLIASSDKKFGPLVLAAACGAVFFQSDAATAFAIGCAAVALAFEHRSFSFAAISTLGFVVAMITLKEGLLPPQPLVEHVIRDAIDRSLISAAALVLGLIAGILHLRFDPQIHSHEGKALAALLLGFFAISLLGPFPTPLLGYGAAPIIGFGLALGAVRRTEEMGIAELLAIESRTR